MKSRRWRSVLIAVAVVVMLGVGAAIGQLPMLGAGGDNTITVRERRLVRTLHLTFPGRACERGT